MPRLNSNREAERRIQDRIESRIAARFERRIATELRKAAEDAADAYRAGRSTDAAIQQHRSRIEQALTGLYTAAFEAVGGRVAGQLSEISKRYGKRETKQEDDRMSEEMRTALDRFIRTVAGRKITQITRTTSEKVAADVKRGIEEGLDVEEIASLIAQHGRELAGYRANMIARTESHAGAQFGSLSAAKESKVVEMKEWIPVEDGRTRDNVDYDHVNVDPVPVNEPFLVSGESLMYPGDPAGSPGNVINCRCAMGYIV